MADFNKKVTLIEVQIDNASAVKETENLSEAIIKQQDAIKKNNEELKKLEKTQKNEKTATAENAKAIIDLKKKNLNLKDGLKDLNRERANSIKASKLLNEETKKQSKSNAELAVKLSEQAKKNKQLAREKLGLVGLYERESRKLIDLRKQYKDVALAEGASSKSARKLAKSVKQLDTRLKRVDANAGQFQRNVGNYGKAWKGVGNILRSAGLLGGVAGVIMVLRNAFKTIVEFQAGVSNLASVLDKPVNQIKALVDNATKLGATTAKTATEILGLEEAYARLGFKQQAIIDLTKPTIDASVALNANLSETAELAGAVVNSFDDLNTADAPIILDQITAATQNSALTFDKLKTAIPNVAGAASAAGVPFSKLLSLLGKLSDSGIDASTSSTALKNIFIESAAQGLNYEQILQKITDNQDKLTAANDEFGKRAVVSAVALAKNIESTKELDLVLQGAAGTAERAANVQLDNLKGAITLLSSGFEGFILGLENGEGALGKVARATIDATTAVFNFLTPTQKASDLLKEEQIEINNLVFQLGDLNIKEEERLKLTIRLNEVAPELVGTLDDQGIATDKTREALDKLNDSFIANIALQIKAEEITEVATKEAEARLDLIEKEAKLRDEISRIRREGTNEQKILIDQGQKEGLTNIEIAKSLDQGISSLNEYALRVKASSVSLENAAEKTAELRAETEKLKESFIETSSVAEVESEKQTEIIKKAAKEEKLVLDERTKARIKAEKDQLEKIIKITEEEEERKIEREEELAEEERDRLFDNLEELQAIRDRATEKEIQKIKDGEDLKKSIIKAAVDAAQNAISLGFDIAADRRAEATDREKTSLELKHQDEQAQLRQNLDNGLITQEQFDIKSAELEKKFALEQHAIAVAKFKSDKKASLGEIAIQTAVAIAKALASAPPPANFIAAGIVGGAALLQTIAVLSQQPPPAPQFAEGGDVFGTVIRGKSHAQGGENIHVGGKLVANMQGDEGLFVTKKEATNPALALLSGVNERFGGASMFGNSSRFLQQGGPVGGLGASEISQLASEIVAGLPTPVVEVQSIMAGINADIDAKAIGIK